MNEESPNPTTPTLVSIESRNKARQEEAGLISKRLGIPIRGGEEIEPGEIRLVLLDDRIEIWDSSSRRKGALVDFSGIDVRTGSGNLTRQQPLARAIGGRSDRRLGTSLSIIDATAGFGHDAFMLACMGHHVIAIEREPLVHLLLDDSHTRAVADPELGPALGDRLQVVHGDSTAMLLDMDPVDVIYLDPMFDLSTRSSALPKKRAQLLRTLVPAASGDTELFRIALLRARNRVVVKRASGDPPLVPTPDLQVPGKIARYDVYLPGSTV